MKSEINWIPCSERLPRLDGEDGVEFLVIVEEQDVINNDWIYSFDLAWFGNYIDNFWNTCVDWCEGQEVHIIYWAKVNIPDEVIKRRKNEKQKK